MSKLPANKNLLFSVLIICVLFIIIFIAVVAQNYSTPTSSKKQTSYQGAAPNETIKRTEINGFNGTVTELNTTKNSLKLANSQDKKTYSVVLKQYGLVSKGGKIVKFDAIKQGSSITVYSNQEQKLSEDTVFPVNLIDIFVKVDPNTLKPIE